MSNGAGNDPFAGVGTKKKAGPVTPDVYLARDVPQQQERDQRIKELIRWKTTAPGTLIWPEPGQSGLPVRFMGVDANGLPKFENMTATDLKLIGGDGGGGGGGGPSGPGPFGGAAESQLLATQVPGIYINPNTGATIDLSVQEARGLLMALVDPNTGQPIPGMFQTASGDKVDLRPETLRDPLGVADILLRQYGALVDVGRISADDAWRRFDAQWKVADEEYTRWRDTEQENRLRQQQNIDAAQRKYESEIGAMSARTSRAREAAAVMSSSVPGMTGLNLPLIGNMPVNQFTLGGLFGPDIGAAPELPPALPKIGRAHV